MLASVALCVNAVPVEQGQGKVQVFFEICVGFFLQNFFNQNNP
jgi:hypothetical protein